MAKKVQSNAIERQKKPGGVTGKGFVSGQSGNPGGIPKELVEVRELCRALTPQSVGALAEIIADKGEPAAARVAAVKEVLNRAWGQPTVGEPGKDGEQLLRIITGVMRGDG